MTYVITTACEGTCNTACVDVCPVDCIIGERSIDELRRLPAAARGRLVIDPDECTSCGACANACPTDAIIHESVASAAERAITAQLVARIRGR